jgi:hypothetical protein
MTRRQRESIGITALANAKFVQRREAKASALESTRERYALGDDVRHGLGRLGFRKPRIAGQRQGNADRQVSRIGWSELVVGVGHAEDD